MNGDHTPPPNASKSAELETTDENSLLRSAGKEASDGAAALRQGYGTMSPENASRPRGMSDGGMSAKEASQLAEMKASASIEGQDKTSSPFDSEPTKDSAERENQHLKVPEKTIVSATGTADDEANDSVGDMVPPTRERSARRQARSGSITETTVDIGGMKKVVLETTSSSSDDEGERRLSGRSRGEAPCQAVGGRRVGKMVRVGADNDTGKVTDAPREARRPGNCMYV